jgi:predicted alpha/beta-hydrolase family hydrolase
MLFVQGTRDGFGTPADLAPIVAALPAPADVLAVENGDHSFKVTGIPRSAQDGVIERLLDDVVRWVRAKAGPGAG